MGTQPLTAELRERTRKEGAWFPSSFAELFDRNAAAHPDKPAVGDQTVSYSYQELAHLTRRVALGLSEVGVRAGDVVAVQSPNRVWLPVLHLACNRLGAIFLPLSEGWRRTEIEYLLKLSGARAVCVPPKGKKDFDYRAVIDEIRTGIPTLEIVISLAGDAESPTLPELADTEGDASVLSGIGPEEWSFCLVSSGTTSMPKISKWTDIGLNAKLLGTFAKRINLTDEDTALSLAPASMGSTGYVYPVLAPLLVGATSVIMERWVPEDSLALIEKTGATYASVVPTQMVQMLRSPEMKRYDLSSFTRFFTAGAPLPVEVARRIEEEMRCRITSLYGSTDGGACAMTSLDDPDEKRHTTVGRRVQGMEVRVVDAMADEELPHGEPGEVAYRGITKTLGYVNQPEREEEMFVDGWYRSGDMGVLDSDGYLSILGRTTDMIIRGGQNISPREIEEVLSHYPKVAEVAVVGMPDEVMGERVCAFVAPAADSEEPTLQELTEFIVSHNVAKWKLPERLEIIDSLPLNTGNKVDKDSLRQLAAEKSAR